jgi:hypothetical protein
VHRRIFCALPITIAFLTFNFSGNCSAYSLARSKQAYQQNNIKLLQYVSKIQAKLSKKNLSDPIQRKRIANQLRALRPLVIGMGNLVLPLQQRRRSEFIKFLSSPQKVARVFNDPTFLFLLDQPSLSAETIAALPTIKTLVLVKRYTPVGLEHTAWPNLTSLEKLIMLDGDMTDNLRTAIQNLAKGPKKLQYLNIPHWGVNVVDNAFNGASSLRAIAGFDDVITLGPNSFQSCTSLQLVDFPKLESVGYKTFGQCSTLKHARFPNLINLANEVFTNCIELISVEIPKANVKNIPSLFFQMDRNLTTVVLQNEMVESIAANAFEETDISNMSFPNLNSIGTWAFLRSSLQSANFPKLKTLGGSTFWGCASLQFINFPRLESLNYRTFNNCIALRHVSFPNLINAGGEVFWNCSQLISVEIPKANVKNITANMFRGNVNLTTIVLQNEIVGSIGSNAFLSTAITDISFPNLKTLETSAFQGCTKLRSIILSDQIASVGGNAFYQVTNCTVNFVGHLTTAGAAENGVTLSCANMKAGAFGTVAAFSFTPGADVLEAVSGAGLTTYINGVLGLTRAGVPLLTNVPSGKSVLDLGSAVATTAGLVHVDGSLIDIVKIANVERTWNGSTWA